MVQRGRRRRLSTREDEGKPEGTERGKEGVLVREQRQPCRHGADNVMQGKEEESTRRVVMTQALPLAVPESNSLYTE